MQILSSFLPLAFFLLLLLLHFVSEALSEMARKITKYVNIFLHICLFFVFMLYKIPLEEVALLYLVSLLFYLLANLFFARIVCARTPHTEESGKGDESAV